MADIASQLVFHPVVSQSLKVLATTLGRDKLYRTIQYFARFLSYVLLMRGYKTEAARWNALKTALAGGRKLMRLFKPLEHLQAALRASQLSSLRAYPFDQYTTIARQLSYAGYLSLDAVVWLNSVRVLTLKPATATKVNKVSQRFWLSGILFSIAHGLVKVARLANEAKRLRSLSEKNVGADADRLSRAQALDIDRVNTRYQLIQDSLDFWLPASTLGFVNVNDGFAGIFGMITSLMALQQQWRSVGKTMGK